MSLAPTLAECTGVHALFVFSISDFCRIIYCFLFHCNVECRQFECGKDLPVEYYTHLPTCLQDMS